MYAKYKGVAPDTLRGVAEIFGKLTTKDAEVMLTMLIDCPPTYVGAPCTEQFLDPFLTGTLKERIKLEEHLRYEALWDEANLQRNIAIRNKCIPMKCTVLPKRALIVKHRGGSHFFDQVGREHVLPNHATFEESLGVICVDRYKYIEVKTGYEPPDQWLTSRVLHASNGVHRIGDVIYATVGDRVNGRPVNSMQRWDILANRVDIYPGNSHVRAAVIAPNGSMLAFSSLSLNNAASRFSPIPKRPNYIVCLDRKGVVEAGMWNETEEMWSFAVGEEHSEYLLLFDKGKFWREIHVGGKRVKQEWDICAHDRYRVRILQGDLVSDDVRGRVLSFLIPTPLWV